MTATTIKVSLETRDRLKQSAARAGRTLGEQLEALLEDEARRLRFEEVREAMRRNPPDHAYGDALLEWQSDAWN